MKPTKKGEKRMTQMFHTSPSKIEKIHDGGIFGDCLFFSGGFYSMGPVVLHVYEANFDCVPVSELDITGNEPVINDISECFGVDAETAYELLTGSANEWDFDCDGDKSWWLQGQRGKAAKNQGYDGCEDEDEQGTVYIIPMTGREDCLVECKKNDDDEWIDSEGDTI